jgi:hypothetical protein
MGGLGGGMFRPGGSIWDFVGLMQAGSIPSGGGEFYYPLTQRRPGTAMASTKSRLEQCCDCYFTTCPPCVCAKLKQAVEQASGRYQTGNYLLMGIGIVLATVALFTVGWIMALGFLALSTLLWLDLQEYTSMELQLGLDIETSVCWSSVQKCLLKNGVNLWDEFGLTLLAGLMGAIPSALLLAQWIQVLAGKGGALFGGAVFNTNPHMDALANSQIIC